MARWTAPLEASGRRGGEHAALNPNRILCAPCTLAVCLTPAPASSGDSWAIWRCAHLGLPVFGQEFPQTRFLLADHGHSLGLVLDVWHLPAVLRPVSYLARTWTDGIIAFLNRSWWHARDGDGGPEPYLAQWPLTRRKRAPENADTFGNGTFSAKRCQTALLARNACVRLTLNSISVASSGYDPGSQAALQARSLRRSSAKSKDVDAVSGSLLASRPMYGLLCCNTLVVIVCKPSPPSDSCALPFPKRMPVLAQSWTRGPLQKPSPSLILDDPHDLFSSHIPVTDPFVQSIVSKKRSWA